MRYSITIDNVKSMEWGLTLQEAYLFSWIYTLPSWAENCYIDGKLFYFASKTKACEELSILTDKIDTMYRHYSALERKELIVIKKVDNKDYVLLTDKAKTWNLYDKNKLGKFSDHSEINPTYNNNQPIFSDSVTDNSQSKDCSLSQQHSDTQQVNTENNMLTQSNQSEIDITDKKISKHKVKKSLNFDTVISSAEKAKTSQHISNLPEDNKYRQLSEFYNEQCGVFAKIHQITQKRIEAFNYFLDKYGEEEYCRLISRVCNYYYYQQSVGIPYTPENTIFDDEKLMKAQERTDEQQQDPKIRDEKWNQFYNGYMSTFKEHYSKTENIINAKNIFNNLSEAEKDLAIEKLGSVFTHCTATFKIDEYLRGLYYTMTIIEWKKL